jgi:hypothetical protein
MRIAVSQKDPPTLHVEKILSKCGVVGQLGAVVRFARTTIALGNFCGDLLDHHAPRNHRRERNRSLSHRRLTKGSVPVMDEYARNWNE